MGIGHAICESEKCGDERGFENLVVAPAGFAKSVCMGIAHFGWFQSQHFDIFKQCLFFVTELGLVQFESGHGINIFGVLSLQLQVQCMRAQSVSALVNRGHIGGNQLFSATIDKTIRKLGPHRHRHETL
jgi:hypothetical protein